ncbi:hypothetical protein BUALT_Bualt01G0212500 [Buddleja alternifolia]|uniref:Uncharacterized protein n=1 Tax=Buddleja alternifolia TaxID=168488 RepID=A0AAV6YJR5_9LAMI|nr:hypothetical protein BUALT_Bualt01G0212500 [Buddleja alternifolia]
MNPSKIEKDLSQHLAPPPLQPHHRQHFMEPSIDDDAFSLAEIDLFRDYGDDDVSHTSSDAEILLPTSNGTVPTANPNLMNPPVAHDSKRPIHHFGVHISPEPHISSQFYTFNKESHALMLQCLIEGRLATPPAVLASGRLVWKDRNEDTAYLTVWKRIQDKLTVHVPESPATITGNNSCFLCFKNNSSQFVSYVVQWQEIVMSSHCDADCKHLGLRDTIERIKQAWPVGKKFYGIPKSYIRTCLAACPVCSDEPSGCAPRSKRRRFEYTESFDLPAKEVPVKLQHLATKHKLGILEGRIGKIPSQLLGFVSRDLFYMVNKIRNIADDRSKSVGLFSEKQHLDDVLVVEYDLPDWGDDHHKMIYRDGKDADIIEDDEIALGELLGSNTKPTKPLRHDEALDTDVGLAGMQVDGFYPEHPKWFESPRGLDPVADCDDGGFRHEEIV